MTRHDPDRRQVLGGLAGMTGLATLGDPGASAMAPRAASPPVGLELYTLGDGIASDLPGALRQVAAIGFREVELPSFYGRKGSDLRAHLDAAGLRCPSVHVLGQAFVPGMMSLGDDPARIAAEVNALGAQHVVMTVFLVPDRLLRAPKPGEDAVALLRAIAAELTGDDWRRTADFLDARGRALGGHGLKLSYHPHNPEFAELSDGSTGLEVLMKHTDPAAVSLELDIGWVAAAGQDPVQVIRRHPGRILLMHLKDLKPTPPNTSLTLNSTDVGSGIIDWPAVLAAGRSAGVAHWYVEQEPPFERPRIESARVGYEYLQKLL
jgi:sugar phosphate isomerase/epimerase